MFAVITYVLLLGAGKDPAQFLRSLVPSRQVLGACLDNGAGVMTGVDDLPASLKSVRIVFADIMPT